MYKKLSLFTIQDWLYLRVGSMCNTYKVNYAGCRSLLPLFLSTKQFPFIETRFKNKG